MDWPGLKATATIIIEAICGYIHGCMSIKSTRESKHLHTKFLFSGLLTINKRGKLNSPPNFPAVRYTPWNQHNYMLAYKF